MKKHASCLRIPGLIVFLIALASPTARAQGHEIAVYVDEGRHTLNGHVFISLSDGVRTTYYGFYSKNKALAPALLGGGEVRDDSATEWDVKRVYNINKEAYLKADEAVFAWKIADRAWWVDHHCGDFAETVLEAAGISLPLNWSSTGRNRPGIFGKYLREHGGVPAILSKATGSSSPPNYCPSASGCRSSTKATIISWTTTCTAGPPPASMRRTFSLQPNSTRCIPRCLRISARGRREK